MKGVRMLQIIEETINDPMFTTLVRGATRGDFYGYDPKKKPHLTVVAGDLHTRVSSKFDFGDLLAQVRKLYEPHWVSAVLAFDPLNYSLYQSGQVVYLPKFMFSDPVQLNEADLDVWYNSWFGTNPVVLTELANDILANSAWNGLSDLCSDSVEDLFYSIRGNKILPGPLVFAVEDVDELLKLSRAIAMDDGSQSDFLGFDALTEAVEIAKVYKKNYSHISRGSIVYPLVNTGRTLLRELDLLPF